MHSKLGFPLLMAGLLAALQALPAEARTKPDPCPAARYAVTTPESPFTAVVAGSPASLEDICAAVTPSKYAANRKGITKLKAKWESCEGLTGKVKLAAKILDDCTRMEGSVKAKKFKFKFVAIIEPPTTTTTSLPSTTTTSLPTTTTTTLIPGSTTTTSTSLPGSSTTSTSTPATTTTTVTLTSTTSLPGSSTTTSVTLPPSSTTTTVPGSTTTSTTIIPPNLSLAMTVNPDPVVLGGLLHYELTVTNTGGTDASGVVLRMPVPSNLYSTSGCRAVSDGGVLPGLCAAGADIVWNLGTVAPGQSRAVQFVGLVTVSGVPDGTVIPATASVADGALSTTDTAQADAVVGTNAALVLRLDEDRDPVAVGDTLEYVLRFGNRSASPQLTTSLELTLPPGTSVLDAGGASLAGDTATWTLGTVNDGDSGERRLVVQVDDLGAGDPLVRRASAQIVGATSSARAAVVTQVEIDSPLALVMTATPDPVGLGDLLTYSLTVTNTGGAGTSGVVLQLRVPEGMYSTSGCQAVSDAGVLPGNCLSGRDIEWTLGALAAGASRTVQFVGLVTVAGLADGYHIHASARVADAAGNRARGELTTTVDTDGPLVVTLDESADPVVLGNALDYIVRFGNRGASPLLNTSVALVLPAGVTVVDGGGATISGDTATWSLGTLDDGEADERRVRVEIDPLGESERFVRVARVVAASGVLAARDAVVTQVEADPPLALALTATPDPIELGSLLEYSLTVTNTGGSDAAGVIARMRVPQGMYGTSGCRDVSDGGVAPGNCAAGRDIEWDLGTLAAGASRTVQFVGLVTVAGVPDGSLIHGDARVVDVSGAAARAEATTIVASTPPLALRLDDTRDPAVAGESFEYVLRFGNRGASPLLTTELSLTLPSGVTVLDDGGATVTGDTAVWSLGTLNAGVAGERRITLQVDDQSPFDPLVRKAHAALTSGAVVAHAAEVTQIEVAPPLALNVTATPDPVGLGGLVNYVLTVTNTGAVDSDGVILSQRVPQGLYGTSGCQAVSDGGVLPGVCAAGRDVTWDLGTIAAGASRTVQFTGLVTVSGLANGYLLHSSARVVDVAGAGARAGTTTTITSASPLVLALNEDLDPVAAGETLEYVVPYGNRSAGALTGTSLSLVLPPGVTVTDDGGATVDGNTATWDLGTLAAGAPGEERLSVSVDDLGAADPLVRVARAVIASGTAAARAGAVTQVEVGAPLALSITATPNPVALGALLTYTLTVTNDGGTAADGVELRMPVPEGLYGTSGCNSISDGGIPPGNCVAGRDILWDLGTLDAGASRAVQFVGLVTVSGLPDGTLIRGTARVRDVAGAAARTGVATAVN